MNRFKILNNATTLINDDFIIDPWIYGNLYNNSWSPFPDTKYDKKKLSKIKFCYISHLHQDHWDIETIKYFNKDVIFFIPNMKFNMVIEKTLISLGFKNIKYLDFKKNYNISKKYKIKVVPPLNRYAHETDKIDFKDDSAIAIDTGLLIKTKNDKLNHLILSDNSPYDYSIYKKFFKNIKITSFFFPYNGFADDYPICYENLNFEQKKKISLSRCLTREKYLIKFIKKIKPKYLIPHSSEFSLNTQNKKLFDKIHPVEFRNKFLYSKRIEKIMNIKSFALFKEDSLYIDEENFIFKNISNINSQNKVRKNVKLKFPKMNRRLKFENLLFKSLNNYLTRIDKYKLNFSEIKKWKFLFNLTDKKITYLVNLNDKKIVIYKKLSVKSKHLLLRANQNIMQCILEKKLHMNNCQIGCYLSWKRSPNIFSKDLNTSINFFHI